MPHIYGVLMGLLQAFHKNAGSCVQITGFPRWHEYNCTKVLLQGNKISCFVLSLLGVCTEGDAVCWQTYNGNWVNTLTREQIKQLEFWICATLVLHPSTLIWPIINTALQYVSAIISLWLKYSHLIAEVNSHVEWQAYRTPNGWEPLFKPRWSQQ